MTTQEDTTTTTQATKTIEIKIKVERPKTFAAAVASVKRSGATFDAAAKVWRLAYDPATLPTNRVGHYGEHVAALMANGGDAWAYAKEMTITEVAE